MHDPQYRAEVARQNTAYNQPSFTDFYLVSDMNFGNVPLRAAWLPGSVKALQQALEDLVESTDGDASQAAQAIQRFVKFLDQQKNPDQVSDAARTVLDHQAGNILRAFEG